MVALNLPEPYARIDRLIEGGDTAAAERALSEQGQDADFVEMLRAKLALAQGTQPALSVMNRLVQLMRKNDKLPGIQELYREASRLAYESRQSSLAYSHPPPPMVPKPDTK